MGTFTDSLFERLMGAEGRVYSDHPWDPGGPTNRGVTLATARGLRDGSLLAPEPVALIHAA